MPVGAIIGVRTSGMWMFVIATPSSATSGPMQRLSAANADLEATYAPKRGGYACVPMLEMLMMWPRRRSRIPGSTASISLTESWKFHDMANGLIVIPLWIPQMSFVVGAALLLVAVLDELVTVLRGNKPGYVIAMEERHARGDFTEDV